LYGAAETAGNSGPNAFRGPSTLFIINPANGKKIREVGAIGFNGVSAMDFHRGTGVLYATGLRPADGVQVLLTIDLLTRAGTEVGPVGIPHNQPFIDQVFDVAFRHADGVLFARDFESRGWTLDLTTGHATAAGFFNDDDSGAGLAFSADGTLFTAGHQAVHGGSTFAILSFPKKVKTFFPRINAMKFRSDIVPGPQPFIGSLADGTSDDLFSDNKGTYKNYLVTIDTTTGDVGVIGKTVKGLTALAWYLPEVPTCHGQPATIFVSQGV